MRPLARCALLASLALGGCSDLLPDAERVPTRVVLSSRVVTVVEGSPVPLGVTVLDQNGKPFERLPAWAPPLWSFDAADRVEDRGGVLMALQPGRAVGTVTVAGLSADAAIRVNPRVLGLAVDGVYLTQSVQTYDRSVPLVAGRDALLRVFLRGDQPSFFAPGVRVGLYHDGVLQETLTLSPGADSIPTAVREASLDGSWNGMVPARLVRPGLSLVVEADPERSVPTRPGSQLRYPASGVLALNVTTVPKLWLRLVPIHQPDGTTGRVSVLTRDEWIRELVGMFPIAEYEVDIRTPYVTSTSASPADGSGWIRILNEIAALRLADGSRRYYYGILTHPGGNNIAGIGYIGGLPGAPPAAVGYDRLPRSAGTLAHELGHNFGRRHAPCGGPAGVDVLFPYEDGRTGAHGVDVAAGESKDGSRFRDLMTYCGPEWISDYTYRGVLQFRRSGDGGTSGEQAVPVAADEPSLLVWGRIAGAESVLEPAFEITTRPVLPAGPGPYRVEGLDAAGATLFSYSFQGDVIADVETAERHFAFAIPARLARTERLDRLRV
ncbi:MAG TPA: hypothetical protein VGR37_23070, partial [Longimicrobiaceae bacterium]|nr:hypothetical protein [Longimicrobiaceae bacterium]